MQKRESGVDTQQIPARIRYFLGLVPQPPTCWGIKLRKALRLLAILSGAGSKKYTPICLLCGGNRLPPHKRLLAKRVQSPEVFASESAAVSCFLSAAYVETGKLTVTLSEIDTVNAAEIVNLAPKKRTLFGTLLASAFRSIWTVLTVPGQKELKAMADVDDNVREDVVEPVQEEKQESVAAQAVPCATENTAEPEPVDEELNRIVGIFKLAREQGYTLKLIPGTPEENAPVFDFEHERILRNAA